MCELRVKRGGKVIAEDVMLIEVLGEGKLRIVTHNRSFEVEGVIKKVDSLNHEVEIYLNY